MDDYYCCYKYFGEKVPFSEAEAICENQPQLGSPGAPVPPGFVGEPSLATVPNPGVNSVCYAFSIDFLILLLVDLSPPPKLCSYCEALFDLGAGIDSLKCLDGDSF